jgi:hypothetical protein
MKEEISERSIKCVHVRLVENARNQLGQVVVNTLNKHLLEYQRIKDVHAQQVAKKLIQPS